MPETREAEPTNDSLLVDVTPRRRQSGLTTTEVAGETLVYDLRTHHAHCLNATTAFVWQQCDGERSAAAIAAALEREHGIPSSSGAVWLALEQLDKADLLDRPAQRSGVNLSRRLLLRTVAAAGLAATVLPALSSITAPTASAAGSCPAGQVPCGATCCSAGQICVAGACQTPISDRNLKENFAGVDPRSVLERVASLPVQSWNYKEQDPSVRHIGPMAQDFLAAFGVGEDDRHINVVDGQGVALAAIQGLARLLEEQQQRIRALEEQSSLLPSRLAAANPASHADRGVCPASF